MAEREGFEPPIPVKVWLISSQLHSTGLCHLSALCLPVNIDEFTMLPAAKQFLFEAGNNRLYCFTFGCFFFLQVPAIIRAAPKSAAFLVN